MNNINSGGITQNTQTSTISFPKLVLSGIEPGTNTMGATHSFKCWVTNVEIILLLPT